MLVVDDLVYDGGGLSDQCRGVRRIDRRIGHVPPRDRGDEDEEGRRQQDRDSDLDANGPARERHDEAAERAHGERREEEAERGDLSHREHEHCDQPYECGGLHRVGRDRIGTTSVGRRTELGRFGS